MELSNADEKKFQTEILQIKRDTLKMIYHAQSGY